MNRIFELSRSWSFKSNSRAVAMLLYFISRATRVNVHVASKTTRRGQIRVSIGTLQKELGMTRHHVRSALQILENSGEIKQEATQKGTMVTVCNYDTFQGEPESIKTVSHTVKCREKAHLLLDDILDRPEFTEKKGVLVLTVPVNCGGLRSPQVVFENEVGVVVRLGEDVVRKEKIF